MILRKMPCWGTHPSGLASLRFLLSSTRQTSSYTNGQMRRSSSTVRVMDGWYVLRPSFSYFFLVSQTNKFKLPYGSSGTSRLKTRVRSHVNGKVDFPSLYWRLRLIGGLPGRILRDLTAGTSRGIRRSITTRMCASPTSLRPTPAIQGKRLPMSTKQLAHFAAPTTYLLSFFEGLFLPLNTSLCGHRCLVPSTYLDTWSSS